MSEWVEGRVVENRRWTDELHSLLIEAEIDTFTAGQFTRLALDIDGERIARPYSLVNAPGEQPLEFYFITVPKGPLSERLYALTPGAPIWVARKPAGHFTLANVPAAKTLWLLATGTALGVFVSLLKSGELWQRFEQVILVHGVRSDEEKSYADLLAAMADQHPGCFKVIYSVTRPESGARPEDRIPVMIADGRLQAQAEAALTPESSQVMICGNPQMVNDTLTQLEILGMRKNRSRQPGHITTEKYW